MEINFWYLGALVALLVYIIPVLVIRAAIDRRRGTRRINERRISIQAINEEKRQSDFDRRHRSRRG